MNREDPCRSLSRRGFATARISDLAKLGGVSGLGQHGATNVAETVDLPADLSAEALAEAEALAKEGALTRLIQSLRPTP